MTFFSLSASAEFYRLGPVLARDSEARLMPGTARANERSAPVWRAFMHL
jgi:hypothetical protein